MADGKESLNSLNTYKYGFRDDHKYFYRSEPGLTEKLVQEISNIKGEPEWMLEKRLQAYQFFIKKPMQSWGPDLSAINFDDIIYYARPNEKKSDSWESVPDDIRRTFDKIGVPEAERKFLGGVSSQYDCLTGDSLIPTNPKGLKRISEINVGDNVFALNEKTKKIEKKKVLAVIDKGERPVFKVNVAGRNLKVTHNHPFLSLVHYKKDGKRRGRYKTEWRYLSDLKVGDLIAIAKNLPVDGRSYHLSKPTIVSKIKIKNQFNHVRELDIRYLYKSVKLPSITDADLMWLFGLFIGDGWVDKSGKVSFAIPDSEPEVRKELERVVKSLFGIKIAVENEYKMSISSVIIANFFRSNYFDGNSKTKSLPSWVYSLPKNELLAFLGGYIDSDGTVRLSKKCHEAVLTSVNKKLLEDVRSIIFYCGLQCSSVTTQKQIDAFDKKTEQTFHRLHISGNTSLIKSRNPFCYNRFGQNKYYHTFNSAKNTTFRNHISEDLGFAKIELIEPAGEEHVFDISVEDHHNFVADGIIVHNSEVVYHNLKKELSDQGIIFLDMDSGLKEYPEIVKKYFGTVIPANDNKFASLNTAVWSGGSFIYVPKGVHVNIPLQAYFRINTDKAGQFERTLIIAEEGSSVHYVEGCFTEGTIVETEYGPKKIEDVVVGDNVLTHTKNLRKVYHTQVRKYSGNLNHIHYLGDTTRLLNVTDEHPFLSVKREKLEYKNKNWEPKWTEAKYLDKFDYLAIPINRNVVSEEVRVFKIMIGRGRHGFFEQEIAVKTDADFFRLAGYYLAEGSIIDDHYLTFTFNKRETKYIEDTLDLLKKYFGKDALRQKEYKNGISIVLCSTLAARLFKELFGKGAENKKIPDWMLTEDTGKQSELVKGYWRGDGNYLFKHYSSGTKQCFRMNTISEKLVRSVRAILFRLNIFASINLWKRKGNRKNCFALSVGGNFVQAFGEVISFSSAENIYVQNGQLAVQKLKNTLSYAHIGEEYAFVPIKNIVKEKVENIDVYNFSVEDDESYIADGVTVHNCSAPIYTAGALHSAVVELIAMKDSHIRYTTIQNWSGNVYNLVTKRSVAYENAFVEWLDGNIGSKVTMKYPSVILKEPGARGEVISVAYAGKGQHQDAGAKIYHMAPNTTSRIISKSISKEGGRTSYRGLVKIVKGAKKCKSFVQCDAYMLDKDSRSDTYPKIQINEDDATVAHEAKVGKISDEKLFYLMSRGISAQEAIAIIILGFIEEFTKELPMEYAVELNRLVQLELEGAVG